MDEWKEQGRIRERKGEERHDIGKIEMFPCFFLFSNGVFMGLFYFLLHFFLWFICVMMGKKIILFPWFSASSCLLQLFVEWLPMSGMDCQYGMNSNAAYLPGPFQWFSGWIVCLAQNLEHNQITNSIANSIAAWSIAKELLGWTSLPRYWLSLIAMTIEHRRPLLDYCHQSS